MVPSGALACVHAACTPIETPRSATNVHESVVEWLNTPTLPILHEPRIQGFADEVGEVRMLKTVETLRQRVVPPPSIHAAACAPAVAVVQRSLHARFLIMSRAQ